MAKVIHQPDNLKIHGQLSDSIGEGLCGRHYYITEIIRESNQAENMEYAQPSRSGSSLEIMRFAKRMTRNPLMAHPS
jgi:hypothetical protein